MSPGSRGVSSTAVLQLLPKLLNATFGRGVVRTVQLIPPVWRSSQLHRLKYVKAFENKLLPWKNNY